MVNVSDALLKSDDKSCSLAKLVYTDNNRLNIDPFKM